MAKTVIHVTEAEAARDFADILIRVRAGAEVIIEKDARPVAIIHAAEPERRTISESMALLPENSDATIDADFAKDVEAAIASRLIHPHGIDSRFKCPDRSRAYRQQCQTISCSLATKVGDTDIAISVVTLTELAHGAARVDNAVRKATRTRFIEDLMRGLPIHPISAAIAIRAGEIDGKNKSRGVVVPLVDLLIGVTALELGYGILTKNVRHFRMISGLVVTQY